MESKDQVPGDVAKRRQAAKKAYDTPHLSVLGTADQLTRGGNAVESTDEFTSLSAAT